MPELVGVRFRACGKIYNFEVADGMQLNEGDLVIVESEMGLSIGTVIKPPAAPPAEEAEAEHKKILRLATAEDLAQREANKGLLKEAFDFCKERIMARGLQMKLIQTEATLDRKRIIFYFVAEKRVDFRELVKDLAQKFRTRIEMRQVGVRDEARLAGGLGICGRKLCCSTFLTDFAPVTIKMAKKQELVLNTGKLSGCCGRLMCCLGYEYTEGAEPLATEPEEAVLEEAKPAIEPGSEQKQEPESAPELMPERKRLSEERQPLFEKSAQEDIQETAQAAAPRPAEENAPAPEAGKKRRKRRWKKRGRRPGPPPQAR